MNAPESRSGNARPDVERRVLTLHAPGEPTPGRALEGLGDRSSVEALRRSALLDGVVVCRMPAALVADRADSPVRLTELLDALPALVAIVVESKGEEALSPDALERLRRGLAREGVDVAVELRLAPHADACAALVAGSGPLAPVLARTRSLRAAGIPVRWRVPLLPELVYRLEAISSLARDEGVDPVLAPDDAATTIEALDDERRQFLWDFVRYRALEEDRARIPPERVAFLEALAAGLRDPRGWQQALHDTVPVLHASAADTPGTWCLRSEPRPHLALAAEERVLVGEAHFATDLAGRMVQLADVASVLGAGLRALGQWLLAFARGRGGAARSVGTLRRVLVIGAYGGEHIGDAAILGGVLLRTHARFGVERAILMSQRPEHTRHLVPMLDLPVRIEVDEHVQGRLATRIPEVDGVVYAGGPLMDIPRHLVNHLYAVALARRLGKPLVVEGIGAGPFGLAVSEWVARRIVRMASRISVRTQTDGAHRLLRGLSPEVLRDPAFDYLDSRPAELTRLSEDDRTWLDDLFRDTDGRPVIGINLRPLPQLWTVAEAGEDPVAHTRAVEAEFITRLAAALRRLHHASPRPPRFVFYTMNGIQFGGCDLRCAYQIARSLGEGVDYRVWEADPSLDAVLAFLRRADGAIAMRFHAAIFALSQGRPVIGIDYRIGKRDKVQALLDDFGQSDRCGRVDQITTEWVEARLLEATATSSPEQATDAAKVVDRS